MGFGGYLNCLQWGAGSLLPLYSSPATTCHEMAHQIGFASECNFIGFLASVKNDDLYFKYSGYSFALLLFIQLANKRRRNLKLLKTVPCILKLQREWRFWDQYDTFIDKGFHAFMIVSWK
jgi:hypothetical protein